MKMWWKKLRGVAPHPVLTGGQVVLVKTTEMKDAGRPWESRVTINSLCLPLTSAILCPLTGWLSSLTLRSISLTRWLSKNETLGLPDWGRSNDTGAALCKNGVVETTVDDHSLTRHESNRNAQKYELHGRHMSLKFV
jgi:hypothetical protein